MSRYKLKDKCIFVDAVHHENHVKKPDDFPFPHVFNHKTKTYVPFNDAAAFIARFLVLGVDTKDIAQILVSEYTASKVPDPEGEVKKVYEMMKDYLDDNRPLGTHKSPGGWQAPPAVQLPPQHTGKLTLDFNTNPVGINYIKVPIS